MMKRSLYAVFMALFFNQFSHAKITEFDDIEFSFGSEVVFSGYKDEALRKGSGGLEAQVYQVTRALLELEITKDSWGVYLEPVLAGDQVEFKKDDKLNYDYYRSIGNDLYYYGELPLREAYAFFDKNGHDVKLGRQQSLLGLPFNNPFFSVRHHAPHSLFKDQEIITGVSYAYQSKWFIAGMGLFSGDPRPGGEYNYQHEGNADPNLKTNNTTIKQLSLTIPLGSALRISGGWQDNKTGSAPGNSEFSGKHNDKRYLFGLEWGVDLSPDVSWNGYYQYARYIVGLTESGSQGNAPSVTSLDITKRAKYIVTRLNAHQWFFQLGYEEYDRADTNVFVKVAGMDPSHPVMSDVETNTLVSLGYAFKNGLSIEFFHKKPEFSYTSASFIPESSKLDKVGVIFKLNY